MSDIPSSSAVAQPVAGATRSGTATMNRLALLFDRHHDRLFRLGLRLTGDRPAAEDLLQETFLRAARAPHRLPADDGGCEAWLCRVLVNLSHDRHRKRAVRRDKAPALEVAGRETDPTDPVVARTAVSRALETLSARRRAVVVLRELEGLSTTEVARLLRLRPATVRWHHANAIRALRRFLEGERP